MSKSLNANRYGISQGFGEDRLYYLKYGYIGHPGIDTKHRTGSNVICEDPGTARYYPNAGTAGNMLVVRTPRSRTTYNEWRYLHLSAKSKYVKNGSQVKRGQAIAKSGNTGDSTAPHLHFDVTPRFKLTGLPVYPLNGYKGKRNPLKHLEAKY